jgi:UDP-N-acetylmuramoyl-tripeptide--D-alanyl-D-alanine ligase
MSDINLPMHLSLKQIKAWLSDSESSNQSESVKLHGDEQLTIQRVNTDSRTVQAGDLFVALRGERFDANDFLPDVANSGASAALAHRGLDAAKLAGLEVADTRLALGSLAKGWRSQFDLPVIAVTGSNGKTTVTQMIASILRAGLGDDALATQGNLNNDIGVPQTLLRLRGHHRGAVVELGMNHAGEIAGLAAMTQPTVALVNNAQREHQEHMATVDAVAQENGEVIHALPIDGVAVFPANDAYTPLWQSFAGERMCMRFSMKPVDASLAEVQLINAEWLQDHWSMQAQTPMGVLHTQLNIAGRHNVSNALAATAAALAAGVSLEVISQGLKKFEPVKGRSRAFGITCGGHDVTVVDDTYNANPDSVRAAIDVLAELPGPRLLVLGDMGEVGTQGPEFHQEVGQHAVHKGIDHVLCLGELAAHSAQAVGKRAQHFVDIETLNKNVTQLLPQVGSVLVKGSRFMKMERVIDVINACQGNSQKETTPCC